MCHTLGRQNGVALFGEPPQETTAASWLHNPACNAISDLAYHILNRRVGRLPIFEDQKMVSLFSAYSLASRAALHFPFDKTIQAAYE